MGKMVAGDGGTFHRVEFDALTFYPKLQEIVRGEIVDITDFGAFVRIGPTDALLHLSQVMDDYLKSDVKSGIIIASQSGRTLKVGSTLRSRITAVSLGKGASMGKIGITCRQPHLGTDEWIAEGLKAAAAGGSGGGKGGAKGGAAGAAAGGGAAGKPVGKKGGAGGKGAGR